MACSVVKGKNVFLRRRRSEAVLTLRPASVLHQEDEEMSKKLRQVIGDFGMALFAPLHLDVPIQLLSTSAEMLDVSSASIQTEEDPFPLNLARASTDIHFFDHEFPPVKIEPPVNCDPPRILNDEQFQQIVDEAIPSNLGMYKWRRIFSIAEHGDVFLTFLEKVLTHKFTLLVLKTAGGHVLGGFASEYWKDQEGFDKRHRYFGFGTCFLFSDFPKNEDPSKKFSFYQCTGQNDYFQICDSDKAMIAMGGGNSEFGLMLQDNFMRGSSGQSSTFNNPRLIPGNDEGFDIVELEVYGLMPLIPTVSENPCLKSKYSQVSFIGP